MTTTQGDDAIADFLSLCLGKSNAIFLGDGSCQGRATNRNATGEKALALDVKKIACFCTNIDQQYWLGNICVGIPVGVEKRHRRHVDTSCGKTGAYHCAVDFIQSIRFDGDECDFFLTGNTIEQFVIPDHGINRERQLLLGLEGDQLLDIIAIERWKFDKASENGLAGDGVADFAFRELKFLH